jgi:outer membrane protein insertion porin family
LLWAESINITHVNVKCIKSDLCKFFKKNTEILNKEFPSRELFLNSLEVFYSTSTYRSFNYSLNLIEENKYVLNIELEPELEVKKVTIKANRKIDVNFLKSLLYNREKELFDEKTLENDLAIIKRKLEDLGFIGVSVRLEKVPVKSSINLNYNVHIEDRALLKKVTLSCKSPFLNKIGNIFFEEYLGRPFKEEIFLKSVKELEKIFNEQGYYYLRLKESITSNSKNSKVVNVECGNEVKTVVDFNGPSELSKDKFYEDFRKRIGGSEQSLGESEFKELIESSLFSLGRNDNVVDVRVTMDHRNYEKIQNVNILIKSTHKTQILEIVFSGNRFIEIKRLKKIVSKFGSDLTNSNYLDLANLEVLVDQFKKEYALQGFLSPLVKFYVKPRPDDKKEVAFVFDEGARSYISEIKLGDLDDEMSDKIKKFLGFEIGEIFNPFLFQKKIEDLKEHFQSLGFYYFEILNESAANIITYERNNRDVSIYLEVFVGDQYFIDNLIIFGVNKTKFSVIERKLAEFKGQALTPENLKLAGSSLASLGIFKFQDIDIIKKDNSKVDLVVKVAERDFGVIELAPGLRSDLGAKVWSRFSLGNIFGRNQTLSFTSQVNYRLSLRDLEDSRTSERFLEYFGKVNYLYPDLLKTYWDYSTSLSTSKKRFFSFDANILRLTNTMRREINRFFSFSLTHRFEDIEQFNASRVDDDGKFRIGSLTPGFVLDLRDNPVVPRKGAQFQLNCEFAKPAFFSQSTDEFKVDFYKLISRNKFYIPINSKIHIASSFSVGFQKNLADQNILDGNGDIKLDSNGNAVTKGFIPSIKVFRLTGIDSVRGYDEDEINVIKSENKDVSEITIRDTAYMTNFKIEPRYSLNDNMMLGVFLDGGSVQVGSLDLGEYRSSVGLSFKYVTPVGTLDLDYGFKTERRILPSGDREAPGRIHLQIGFF